MGHITESNKVIPGIVPADRGTFNPSGWEVSWKMNIFLIWGIQFELLRR